MKRKLRNYPIGKRLTLTFSIILVLFSCTVVLSIFNMFKTGGNLDQFYNEAYKVTNKSSDMRTQIQTLAKLVGYSMMDQDANQVAGYVSTAETTMQEINDGITYLYDHYEGDQTAIDNFSNGMNSIKDDMDNVFKLAANKDTEATKLYFSNVLPKFLEANDNLVEVNKSASVLADNSYNSANLQKNISAILLISVAIITFIITIILARYIINNITTPIHEMEKAAKEMLNGSLNVTISYESQDELGSLADSMRNLTGSIQEIVNDIGVILGQLAEGNFKIKSSCADKYKLDYFPILSAMRLIRDNLSETILKILEASQQVAAGSAQMAETSQGLAEGAADQASSVQQLMNTIENVSTMSEQSYKQSKQSYEQIKISSEKTETSKNDINELIAAMDRISNTSKEIENIIAAIEDIASQTNLLSLNASIEAARAGEAGRGFAVVADQIGKLASDSAQSAVNTKELINKTLQEINSGNLITQKTSEAFEYIIGEMKRFAEVAHNTSKSSMEQFESMKEIRAGIDQISSVVENNSASAQESSSTSEELSAQAEYLKEQVNRFQLDM